MYLFELWFSLDLCPGSGIAESYDNSIFTFLINLFLYSYGCTVSSLLHWGFLNLQRVGLLFAVVCGFLTSVALLVVGPELWSMQASGVVVHRLSCSVSWGIFQGQGSNPCRLHWQADS